MTRSAFTVLSLTLAALLLPATSFAEEPKAQSAETKDSHEKASDTQCEIVLIERVEDGANIARFHPADAFLDSVYDAEEGYIKRVDDNAINGVLCERANVIPTLRDFPVLATGIPLSLSEDFDTPDSRLITLYYDGEGFTHVYKGEPLSDTDQASLADTLEIFNLQPHTLKKKITDKTPPDKTPEE